MWFLLFVALAIPSPRVQDQTQTKTEPFDDHAIVTPRRTARTQGSGEDRYTDVTNRPVVTGLRPVVLKKVREELELNRVLGPFLYNLYKDHQLLSFDYRVTYNRNHILAITFTYNYFFADDSREMVFDLRDGRLLKPADLFVESRMKELTDLVDVRLRKEIEEIVGDNDLDRWLVKAQGELKVTPEDLDNFSIDDKGITICYKAGFHHTAQRVEPTGRYFFTYSELKSFLKPATVVSQFVK